MADDGPNQRRGDFISALYNPLRLKILSLLPVKDAVKTGTLSTEWEDFWTSMDEIDYIFDVRGPGVEYQKLIAFVNTTLGRFNPPIFKKFSLCMPFINDTETDLIRAWLDYVLFTKRVESFKVWFGVGNFFNNPEGFFHNEDVVNMELQGWALLLDDEVEVNLTRLRSLTLANVKTNDESMGIILTGCPSLELIVLSGTFGINHLQINSPGVKKLKMFDFEPDETEAEEDSLKITAPFIKELEISGAWFAFIRLGNVSSLTNSARLTFQHDKDWYNDVYSDESCVKYTLKLLAKVSLVEDLVLGPLCIQVLSWSSLDQGSHQIMFGCKYLTLESCVQKEELHGIAYLLKNSPHLATLTVVNEAAHALHFLRNHFDRSKQAEFVISQEREFPMLKDVKFVHKGKVCFKKAFEHDGTGLLELTLAELILKNSRAMEKMVISAPKDHCKECSTRCALEHLPRVYSRLLSVCSRKDGRCMVKEREATLQVVVTFTH